MESKKTKLQEREQRRRNSLIESMVQDVTPLPPIQQVPLSPSKSSLTRASAGEVVPPPLAERKTRRKQVLLQPSVHDSAQAKCDRMGISMNEVINQLLQNWVQT